MASKQLKKLKRRAVAMFLVSACLAWLGIRWGNNRSAPNGLYGGQQTQLSDCPDSPNCVSTSSSRSNSRIEPIAFHATPEATKLKLAGIIRDMPGSRIVKSDNFYIHAEFRSRVFGFVDDLEVLIDEAEKLIFLRSASRIGYSDLGVNRKRVEQLRNLFAER